MKSLLTFCLLALSLLSSVSCKKMPRNGWLDGQWQLTHIDERDVKSGGIYWSFQLDLVQFRAHSTTYKRPASSHGIAGRFHYNGKQLSFNQIYALSSGNDRIITPEEPLDLAPLGLPHIPITYKVEHIDDQTMVLQSSPGPTLRFRKF